jgi:cytochrome c
MNLRGSVPSGLALLVLPWFATARTGPAADSPAAKDGSTTFKACAACHAPDQPGVNGPELRGVVGRRAGSVPGYRYSRALRNAGWNWTPEKLDEFLADPQAVLPGNAMPYPGLPDPDQRLNLINYLSSLK